MLVTAPFIDGDQYHSLIIIGVCGVVPAGTVAVSAKTVVCGVSVETGKAVAVTSRIRDEAASRIDEVILGFRALHRRGGLGGLL
jgi:hypothetical protein